VKSNGIAAIVVTVLVAGCTSTGAPIVKDPESFEPHYEIVDMGEIVLVEAEESWCNTLEGSAGAWLVANDRGLIIDQASGRPGMLGPDIVRLLETVVSEGHTAISPDEFEELDTFLRFPAPSPLACRTAFETRDR
jgi:hypothetical protein